MESGQPVVDQRNAEFWDELCGAWLARSLGISERSPESLAAFDEAYMALYPYLSAQLPQTQRAGERLLEIGLGYGTAGQKLAERGFEYYGVDIAAAPVEMMRYRLGLLGSETPDERVIQGSALAIPFPSAHFSHVVSIGCLHHTGDLAAAIAEVLRVLKPGGTAVVMVYNRHSLRHLALRLRARTHGTTEADAQAAARATYDGAGTPATEFVSARQIKRDLFAGFESVHVERRNFQDVRLGSLMGTELWIPRRYMLPTIARVAGLDLYVRARK